MKLYNFPMSPNARVARMVAHKLGTELELETVNLPAGEQHSASFVKINPNGAIPVLDDDGFILTESNAIMIYLCEKAGEAGESLYPSDLQARSTVNRWLFWMSNQWGPHIHTLTHENLLKGVFGRGEPDQAQVEIHNVYFRKYAMVLETVLGNQNWIAGKNLTIADYAIAAPLMFREGAKLPMQGYTNLREWFERVQELPEWQATEPSLP